MLLVVLALGVKLLLPAGIMPAPGARTFTVMVCSETGHQPTAMQLAIPFDRPAPGSGSPAKQDTASGACPYAGLALGALPAADPLQLALAIAFLLALGFAAAPPLRLASVAHLRPPSRGPPRRA